MRYLKILAFVALALASVQNVAAGTGYGQITFDNQTSVTLDFYVDNGYACRALSRGFCTSQVQAGGHTLSAKIGEEVVVSDSFSIDEGDSLTYTVTESE